MAMLYLSIFFYSPMKPNLESPYTTGCFPVPYFFTIYLCYMCFNNSIGGLKWKAHNWSRESGLALKAQAKLSLCSSEFMYWKLDAQFKKSETKAGWSWELHLKGWNTLVISRVGSLLQEWAFSKGGWAPFYYFPLAVLWFPYENTQDRRQ